MSVSEILIRGARVHNLKNLSLSIPKNKLIVITGLSGSGKSSLAFDTLYAEGQRRYVESLSSYARQFLERMDKPDVDFIQGISPAIAIEQKVNNRNPRSTVGTSTEIYEYLKLLYARIGRTYSPVSGQEVKHHSISEVVDFILSMEENKTVKILCPYLFKNKKQKQKELELIQQKGYSRVMLENTSYLIHEITDKINFPMPDELFIEVDRLVVKKNDEDLNIRMADSIQSAFYEGDGFCAVTHDKGNIHRFSSRFECDGINFEKPTVQFFSFNTSYGACPVCEGFGSVLGISEDLVVPDKTKSIYDGAIACWKGEKMSEWNDRLVRNSTKFNFPIHRSWQELKQEERNLIWNGNKYFKGLHDFFNYLESESYKIQYRVMLSRYRGKTTCHECKGGRLRKEASWVKLLFSTDKQIHKISISEINELPVTQIVELFKNIMLNNEEKKIAKRILLEIQNRLQFLLDVGLDYLTLNRLSSTLSGGESQRINLATSLGSSLVGSLYILDEPSIGLHPRDTQNLIQALKKLKSLGNTVIIVEHDENIIRSSDQIIDLGPGAGSLGGEIIFQGEIGKILTNEKSLTGKFLSGNMKVSLPGSRRKSNSFIEVFSCTKHNLKNIRTKFPLYCMNVVTGVSGSGKSTLVMDILAQQMSAYLNYQSEKSNMYGNLKGDISQIDAIEVMTQSPLGKSSRSNPATYVKAWELIRELYAELPQSINAGLKPSSFSFNVDGGRCPDCKGEGFTTIEMQFMADIRLKCDTCNGKRFTPEVLEIQFSEKNVYEILEMTIEDALSFFKDVTLPQQQKNSLYNRHISSLCRNIVDRIRPLQDVGLGYLRLGQSTDTLSGGEAQRVKLASFLNANTDRIHTNVTVNPGKRLFIFDEPTTGLHFQDVAQLLKAINSLVDMGNTAIIIEHNLDMIKCADWVIDLGPEGGEEGGYVLFEGTPEEMLSVKKNHTAYFLKEKWEKGV
ncbi:MAG: excinuclease ABC subunit A [Bacteroidetes bacterium RIFCSPLOWO2_12_FULL_37_12]|nr:MAG: excinuclease ABC subunit A [Bacteroidetes bacterium RIFCSPLOWO2_12_FULL_37_12]